MAEQDLADLGRRLHEKAAGDEAALQELAGKSHVPDSAVGFFAQQTVEKLLKAVLASRGVRFERTHDLARLAQQASSSGIDLPVEVEPLAELTPWAVELRYEEPIEWEGLDRGGALELVSRIMQWADELID